MARTDKQVVQILLKLYEENFGGKSSQRFLISWADLRDIYGRENLLPSRFDQLRETACEKRLYLWDLGEGERGHIVAVIKSDTVDRWRRVPKQVARTYQFSSDEHSETNEDVEE
jgi:hypothetical protein